MSYALFYKLNYGICLFLYFFYIFVWDIHGYDFVDLGKII